MLQQGLYVADVAYLLPEGAPSSQPFWGSGLNPACLEGYNYDCLNTDVLLNRVSVGNDGRLLLPGGMRYRLLVLAEIDCMTPKILRRIHELVADGATVVLACRLSFPLVFVNMDAGPAKSHGVRRTAARL
jgi:hypothetical protein